MTQYPYFGGYQLLIEIGTLRAVVAAMEGRQGGLAGISDKDVSRMSYMEGRCLTWKSETYRKSEARLSWKSDRKIPSWSGRGKVKARLIQGRDFYSTAIKPGAS